VSVVVDLGCQDYGYQPSLESLVDAYHPHKLYGFDPSPLLDERVTRVAGVPTVLKRQAAWLYDGTVPAHNSGTTMAVGDGDQLVPCFDLSAWLRRLRRKVVLKMDVEGAEYPLLEQLLADGTDRWISELVVEWHGEPEAGAAMAARMACPVRTWWY
jgi:FkbM family methyltransferase